MYDQTKQSELIKFARVDAGSTIIDAPRSSESRPGRLPRIRTRTNGDEIGGNPNDSMP